jgi:hypothetical protein
MDSARHFGSYLLTFSADGWYPRKLTMICRQKFDRVNMSDTPFHNNFSQAQEPECWDQDSQYSSPTPGYFRSPYATFQLQPLSVHPR